MGNGSIKSFGDYEKIYGDVDSGFYADVLKLAKMEDEFSRRGEGVSDDEAKGYVELREKILGQCSDGTDVDDLVGLVVVGELGKKESRRDGRKDVLARLRKRFDIKEGELRDIRGELDGIKQPVILRVVEEDFVPDCVRDFYKRIGLPLYPTYYDL